MSEFDVLPITIVVWEYDKSSSWWSQYGIELVIAIIDCDFSDYEQVYREKIAPMNDVGMGRIVQCHIYRRFPGSGVFPRSTLAPKDELPYYNEEDNTNKFTMNVTEKRDTSYDDLFEGS